MRSILVAAALAAALITPAAAQSGDPERVLGTAYFVQEHCPNMEPDIEMFAAAMLLMGADLDAIKSNPAKIRKAVTWAAQLKAQGRAACNTIWELFGPNGSQIEGLVRRP